MALDGILRRFESLPDLVRSVIDRRRHQSMMLEVEEEVVGLRLLELPFCHESGSVPPPTQLLALELCISTAQLFLEAFLLHMYDSVSAFSRMT